MEYKKFGAIIFETPEDPGVGWASTGVGDPKPFRDHTELPSDVLWWSNCSYDAFYRKGRLFASNLRPANYIDVSHLELCSEWGMQDNEMTPKATVVVSGTLFGHLMKMARGLIRIIRSDLPGSDYFVHNRLAQDLQVLLPAAEFPNDDAASILQSGIGFQNYTATTVNPTSGAQVIRIRRPRFDHAIDMLSTPVPIGPFKRFQGSKIGTAEDIARFSRPVIAEISVSHADPTLSPLFGFGVSMEKRKRVQRSWVPHPELAAMESFTSIQVKNAFLGDRYTTLSKDVADQIKAFLTDGGGNLSWSANILAETIWRAATVGMDTSEKVEKNKVRPQTSWRGAWIKAADKVVTFRHALRLHRAHFQVKTYGSGWISCLVPLERMKEFALTAYEAGLIMPVKNIPRSVTADVLRNHKWGGEPFSQIYAFNLMSKNTKGLWALNRFPLVSSNEERASLISGLIGS